MEWSVDVSSRNNVVKSNFDPQARMTRINCPTKDNLFHPRRRVSGYTAVFFADTVMDEQSSLLALFTSSFLAATLLPGGSEAVLFGVLKAYPQLYWTALAVASVGNTLGGMSSYAIGRFLPDEKALMQKSKGNMRGLVWVRKHGSPILLLSWVPLIGDLLCVAAGWLRLNWISTLAFMAAGKFLRYWAIAAAMSP